MNRLGRMAVSLVVVSISVLLMVTPAVAQSQTPGQITQFDPNLNVVDSVITQDPSGNIGIGTTTPAAALDVATGDLNLGGNLLKGGTLFLHNFGMGNTFVGQQAGNLSMTGFSNTASGAFALSSNDAGSNNTASGALALTSNTTGFSNTATGIQALAFNTTGFGNTATGDDALYFNTTGNSNTAIGRNALYFSTDGSENVAIGAALHNNTTGSFNVAIGPGALQGNTTGTNNIALGYQADVSGGNLINATAIGANARVNASNKIRFGDTAVTVIEGQVPYTFTSDKNQKENFQPVDSDEVLRKLLDVSVNSWNYIGHDPQQFRHYGPVAQEFFAAFGHDSVGTVGTPTTINSGDLEGILIIAMQALDKQNRELKTRIEALERLVKVTTTGGQ